MSVATNLGKLTYAAYYLPALGLGYISTQSTNPLLPKIPHINALTWTIDPILYLYVLTAVAFVGAMQAHGITRAIYGPDGPSARPKHKSIQIRHAVAIILGKDADEIPLIPCLIVQRGIILELMDYVAYRSRKFLTTGIDDSSDLPPLFDDIVPVRPRHRLEIGVSQMIGEVGTWGWRVIPRFLYFIPASLVKTLAWLSLLLLIWLASLQTAPHSLLLLIFAHIVLLFRGYVWAPIPNYFDPDPIDDRFIAEYRKHQSGESRPRIVMRRSK